MTETSTLKVNANVDNLIPLKVTELKMTFVFQLIPKNDFGKFGASILN